jgi:hypothetical protein
MWLIVLGLGIALFSTRINALAYAIGAIAVVLVFSEASVSILRELGVFRWLRISNPTGNPTEILIRRVEICGLIFSMIPAVYGGIYFNTPSIILAVIPLVYEFVLRSLINETKLLSNQGEMTRSLDRISGSLENLNETSQKILGCVLPRSPRP